MLIRCRATITTHKGFIWRRRHIFAGGERWTVVFEINSGGSGGGGYSMGFYIGGGGGMQRFIDGYTIERGTGDFESQLSRTMVLLLCQGS